MSDYRGNVLEILTIALAGISLIVVLVRGIARHRIARVLEPADILLPLALIILLAQSTFVRLAISNGLGRHLSTLSENELLSFQKFTYASNLLFQLLLSLCQIVIILLIKSVEPQLPVRIGCNALLVFIGLYSTVSLTVQAFQCSLPDPWVINASRCLNRQLFLTAFIVAGVLIDFLTLILPIVMVCKLKTSRDKKIFVCILFGARISVPLITIPQIWRLQPLLQSDDRSWDIVPFQLWIQVIMNVSLITACLPSLGRMMWELWAFGSGLRTTWCSKDAEGRDFGHELGLDNGNGQSKGKTDEKVKVQVREVKSFESGSTIAVPQKTLPALPLPRRTTSRFRPVRKQNHHYRRPRSLSPVPSDTHYLPAMQFAALDMPSPTTIAHRFKHEEELNTRSAFPFPPQAPLQPKAGQFARPPRHEEPLPVYARRQPSLHRSPTLPPIADPDYHEDQSSIDIDSYYLMNNIPPYDPSRTEMVLQTMIDELKSQNSSIYSCTQRVQSSVYSAAPPPRMQSSVYSVRTKNDGGWI